MNIAQRLAKAKASLVFSHPFIAAIALNMPLELDPDMKHLASTNGRRIRLNPVMIEKEELTDEHLQFLIAHECFHPMLEHNYRRNGRNPKKWNIAGDFVINQLLHDEKVGKFIPGGCLNSSIYAAGKGTTDGIYAILPDSNDGDIGGAGEDIEDGEGSPAELEQQAAEWRVTVAQAAQAAKMMGKLSANMQRFVDETLRPKVDWRDVLRRFMQKAKTDTRSFARPNRRFLSQGLYLPSVSGEALGDIVVAVDCSGSISAQEINVFAAEMRGIKEDGNPSGVHVVYFTDRVCAVESFTRDDTLTIAPNFTGGTAFSPIFREIASLNIEPAACVVLTDLCCDDFGPAPEYPVLWVSNASDKAPWGEVVKL